jgi:CRP-like cAMP-binding protein
MENRAMIGAVKTLLAYADARARQRLALMLKPVDLPRGTILVPFGEETSDAYFLQAGFASVVARSPDKKTMEVGMIGREGIAPALPTLSHEPSLFDIVMRVDGHGYQIGLPTLHEFIETSPSTRDLLGRFVEAFLVQTTYNFFSAISHSREQRLARCLLMCHDRIDGNDVPLSHKSLSAMAVISGNDIEEVIDHLQGQQMIRVGRNRIAIKDRTGLETVARDCYGRAEYAYRRLIGEFR